MTTQRKWGKAGQRLTPRPHSEGVTRAVLSQAKDRHLDDAYRRWRAGGFCPDAATVWLNARGLFGPEVDWACGVEEPVVDLWEAGELYPTWDQILALAKLCDVPVGAFCRPTLDWRDTSMRFHVSPHELEEARPPVMSCSLPAIHAVTLGAPERRPDSQGANQ